MAKPTKPDAAVSPAAASVDPPARDTIAVRVRVLGNEPRWRGGVRWPVGAVAEATVTLEQLAALEADAGLEVRYAGQRPAAPPPPAPAPAAPADALRARVAELEARLRDVQTAAAAEVAAARTEARHHVLAAQANAADRIAALEREVAQLRGSAPRTDWFPAPAAAEAE